MSCRVTARSRKSGVGIPPSDPADRHRITGQWQHFDMQFQFKERLFLPSHPLPCTLNFDHQVFVLVFYQFVDHQLLNSWVHAQLFLHIQFLSASGQRHLSEANDVSLSQLYEKHRLS